MNQFDRIVGEGLTFDDVSLVPGYSEVLPGQVDVGTEFVRGVRLNVPFVAAAMDTVSEGALAIAIAREGGIAVIHRNLSPEQQAAEVNKVKKSEAGMIVDPVTVRPDAPVAEARRLFTAYGIGGLPVVDGDRLVGIITSRDLRFERSEAGSGRTVGDLMTRDPVTTDVGTTLDDAKSLLHQHRIEKLPVVDATGKLAGLITVKDIDKARRWPAGVKDDLGRLRAAAALGTGSDRAERTQALVDAGVDVLCIDTAHGHSRKVIDAVADTRRNWPDARILAGNIATGEAAAMLIDAGADGLKVGIGPGSICTTRVVAGVGVPQVSAIMDVCSVASKRGVPVVADGGIKYSGEVVKALAAGANTVMMGSMFAGTDEAPGEKVLYQGRAYKVYRGMGSIGAMRAGSADRYSQEDAAEGGQKLVPEGIEGRVPYKGALSEVIHQLAGGLRSGMGYVGCGTVDELRTKPRFVRMTAAGLRESHVHDVVITKEAPNYQQG